MEEKKISIIIPAYNVAGYIEACLDSVLAQTFRDYEVIVVDDGSVDDTPAICDRYAARDARITVIHKDNEGVSAARNTGIERASGEYFLFFDGDDFVEPYACEELYGLIKEKDVDTLIYGYHRYRDGKVLETCRPIFEQRIYEREEIIPCLLPLFVGFSCEGINRWLRREENAFYVENPALWRAVVSAKLIRDNHLRFDTNLKVGEDTIFISDYLSHATRCYIHHKCYYYLVIRETSTIYQYEKNALAKLEGKEKLLTARNELTAGIKQRLGIDITPYWQGTVVMSSLELAFLLARKSGTYSFGQRYRCFLRYARLPAVERAVKAFRLYKKPGIRVLPFLFVKWRWYFLLFLCTTCLNSVHYEFQRG